MKCTRSGDGRLLALDELIGELGEALGGRLRLLGAGHERGGRLSGLPHGLCDLVHPGGCCPVAAAICSAAAADWRIEPARWSMISAPRPASMLALRASRFDWSAISVAARGDLADLAQEAPESRLDALALARAVIAGRLKDPRILVATFAGVALASFALGRAGRS